MQTSPLCTLSWRSRQLGGIALAMIVTLLVVAATTLAIRMARQVEARTQQQQLTQTRMLRIQAALHAFAASQGRLPCPANGAQDTGLAVPAVAVVTCTNRNGAVPWVSLGLQADDALDGWGRKISYRVPDGPNGLTNTGSIGSPGTVGLSVNDAGAPKPQQAWVLISHGASGLGAWQQGVVDPIRHVGDRLVAGKDQFVEHFARTAALGDLQLDPGLFLELCECFLGQTEGIMRHDTQRYLLLG